MANMTPAEKFELIKENLDEILNPEIIEQILPERQLKVYWGMCFTMIPWLFFRGELLLTMLLLSTGTATTGRPHTG